MLVWLGYSYVVLSIITLLVYGKDKWAAKRQAWRTPERTLHLLALLGGWPGALLGQKLFSHKISKISFKRIFWLTVVGNLLIVLGIFQIDPSYVVVS
ncbi:DUF1294 domain-containing protein [Moritella dasanensis]|jgi:uncharacterized membrane protein YsdA (DUF1294 family)|uniref:DUF1294 domain-containing protein n=1 Tax=Moritella dasanensis TaxID=428031 RepID=UPI0002D675DE|nr:DUF1294 domain-containing protein [Moritella dasanensis]